MGGLWGGGLAPRIRRNFENHCIRAKLCVFREECSNEISTARKMGVPYAYEWNVSCQERLPLMRSIRNYFDYFSAQSLFKLKHDNRLSGHDYTICKQAIKKSKYQKFFSNRIINILNNLPRDLVNDKSIN